MDLQPPTYFIGIDYGSKSAGTTVIAYCDDQEVIRFAKSAVKGDADRFILDWCACHRPRQIYLDAPLSLPGVYRQPEQYHDYFYRAADRAVSAMSPMFLGGLTARAIRLRDILQTQGIEVLEVYPSRLAAEFELDKKRYKKAKKHLPDLLQQLCIRKPFSVDQAAITSWHHFDALLAFISGWRHQHALHLSFGESSEGQIII